MSFPGHTHRSQPAFCIVKAGDTAAPHAAESLSFVDVTDVTFYELTDEQIEHYVASGEPMDKAGAYGIQGTGGRMLVHDISGDFYNVVGLTHRPRRARDSIQNSSYLALGIPRRLQFWRTVRIPTGHKARRKTDRS